MKAIFFESHGGIEVLRHGDLPDPVPQPGEALIRVRAVALNHLDIWVRRGWEGLKLDMPHITGSDIAGEIVSVHADTSWTPGARVVINPGITTADDEWVRRGEESLSPGYRIIGEQTKGGLAELVCVPIANVFKLPDTISFEEGAALPLVGTTCWRMLFKRAELGPGQTVLVVGAGGGVNSLSVVLAQAAGATVYALAGGPEKVRFAKELGCEEVIDYRETPNWHVEILKISKGRGVDVVVDNVGAQTFGKSLRAVRRGGKIVTVGNTSGHDIKFDNRFVFTKQVSILGSTIGSRQDFVDAMNFIWSKGLHVPIDEVAPLSRGIELIKKMEEGRQKGKLVLTP